MTRTRKYTTKVLLRCIFIGIFSILLVRTGSADVLALTQNHAMKSIPTKAGSGWNYILTSTAVVATNDIWAVGYSQKSYNYQTIIEHWDGTQWSIVSGPAISGALDGIIALSTTNIWAVGAIIPNNSTDSQTLVEHWDGTQWSIIPSPNPKGEPNAGFGAVAAVSATDIWAVGLTGVSSYPPSTLIEHWDGTQWSIVYSPNGRGGSYLNGVTAISSTDVWAVGTCQCAPYYQTLIEHWDGTQWSVVPSPNPDSMYDELNAVSSDSANDVWAVGGQSNGTLVEHWDGTSWSAVPSTGTGPLYGVVALSTNEVWAVGGIPFSNTHQPVIEHWDSTKWTTIKSPKSKDPVLYSIAAFSSSEIWAVGSVQTKKNVSRTLIEQWNGTRWSIVHGPYLQI